MIHEENKPSYGTEPMTEEMEIIKGALMQAQEPVTSKELSRIVKSRFGGSSAQKHVQKIIKDMNIKHLQPVVSVGKGYLWAKAPSQIAHYRKTKIMNRVNALLVHDSKMQEIQARMEEAHGR